jgi:short-subunit dehydrogenase
MKNKTALIIGGTSGLGLELGRLLKDEFNVYVTGRHDSKETDLGFIKLDLSSGRISDSSKAILKELSSVDLFIYAAGYFQKGTISELDDAQIQEMIDVGLTAPVTFLSYLLKSQDKLEGFIAITSTSQWTPRLLEPVYTAVKSGLGMFANSASLDPKIIKTLVAAPAGMKTKFWANTEKDTSDMLDPQWVAEQVLELYKGEFRYKYGRILRDPARVEVVEERI